MTARPPLVIGSDGLAQQLQGADRLSAKWPVSFFFTSAPTASEVLLIWTPPSGRTIVFPDEWAGAAGINVTHPTGSYAMIVKLNGSSVGTITISTGGAFTFVTTGTTVTVVGGTDYLTIEAPVTPDATCANVTVTLEGAY